MTIGIPSQEMCNRAKKRNKFFDKNQKLIKSPVSRLGDVHKRSFPISKALYCENDPEFVNFVERCLEIDPALRMTPEEALKHAYLRSVSDNKKILKANDDLF